MRNSEAESINPSNSITWPTRDTPMASGPRTSAYTEAPGIAFKNTSAPRARSI